MANVRNLQKGTLGNFLENPPKVTDFQWAHPQSKDKINSVVIPLGYPLEALADPAFQARYKEITDRFFSDFSPDHFNLMLYTGKGPDLVIGVENDTHLVFNSHQLFTLRHRLARIAKTPIDNIHFMVEPSAFDGFNTNKDKDFGHTRDANTVFAGPCHSGERYHVFDVGTLAHEMAHALTAQVVATIDPLFINDYYTRPQLHGTLPTPWLYTETELLKQNCLSEYFLEDPQKPGQILPSASFCITKALEKTKPQFYDTGLTFYNEDTGITHRILSPHDGKGLMSGGFGNNTEGYISLPATAFHRALFEIGADLYLAHTGRKEDPELLQEHKEFNEKQRSSEFVKVENHQSLATAKTADHLTDFAVPEGEHLHIPIPYNRAKNIAHQINHGTYRR